LSDVHCLNKDPQGEKLQSVLNTIQARGYSESLVSIIKDCLSFEEQHRPDFISLEAKVREALSEEKYK
jgi:hypothetical protein